MFVVTVLELLPIYLLPSFVVVASEDSGHYVEAAAVTVVALPVLVSVYFLPGRGRLHLVEQWAAGRDVDRRSALDATYSWARWSVTRALVVTAVGAALLLVVVGAIAGATGWRLVQYGILGATFGTAVFLIAVHSVVEPMLRPARVAIAGDTGIGDSLPRSRTSFAAWSNVSVLATAFDFAVAGTMLAAVFDVVASVPVLAVVIGCALTLGIAVAGRLIASRDNYHRGCGWLAGPMVVRPPSEGVPHVGVRT
jgi:hypothetical protein